MDEYAATKNLTCGLRNSILRKTELNLDVDNFNDIIQESILENWDAFIEAATLAYVQKEIYEALKVKFEK